MTETDAAPTCEELIAADGITIKSVFREVDDSWRHGVRVTEVFHRMTDGSYWGAYYRLSADGETNGLREGLATIARVYPKPVQAVVYVTEPVEDDSLLLTPPA